MNKFIDTYFRGDKTIWFVVLVLSIFSVLAVYSSTGTLAYKFQRGNTEYYLLKHLTMLLLGLVLMVGAHYVKYTYYSRISQLAIVVAVPLLLLTLLIGTNVNQADRWITLPVINLSFQTSDLAKLALITYVARLLSKKQENIKDFKASFVPVMIPVLIVCGLILPANFSTAAMLFTTCLILMFVGRIRLKYILMLIGVGILCLSLFISIALLTGKEGRVGTWISRVENYMAGDTGDNYQAEQSKMAIASGGLVGKGPGNLTQSDTLPHPYSDFIYAVIIGEWGLAGGLLVLLLYLVLFYRSIRIVLRNPKAFGSFLVLGCSISLVFQALINMAVAVNLFPVTGQPLPLISMGGTSILFTCLAIGIILSVSRDMEKDKEGAVAA